MIVYRTADGKFWTRIRLMEVTVGEACRGWDEDTQGEFDLNFTDWLIEAINTGVIKEVEVND